MADDLDRLIEAVEGEGPSPEFVATLRERIVAETETRGPEADRIVEIDLPPAGTSAVRPAGRGRWLLTAAAAVLVVVLGVALLRNDDDEGTVEVIDEPSVTTTVVPELDPDARGVPLTTGNTFVEAGTFRIDTLGTEFTFSVQETTGLLVNENGIVSITDLITASVDDRTVTLRRTAVLPDPSAPTAVTDAEGGWPAADLDGWVEALGDDVAASEPIATTLGGRAAAFVEFELPCPDVGCGSADLFTGLDLPVFVFGSRYRMWVVDQGREDPIVVVAAIDDPDEVGWFDRADAIVASLDFGDVEANPVRRVSGGPVELEAFDGISVHAPDEVVVVEPFAGFARIIPTDIGGDLELLTRPLDTDGVEVTTAQRLLQVLSDRAVEVDQLGAVDIDGVTATVFAVDGGPFENVALKPRVADLSRSEDGWIAPVMGQLWVIEHSNRGLLIASADAWAGAETVEPLRSWVEGLLRTLRFEDT